MRLWNSCLALAAAFAFVVQPAAAQSTAEGSLPVLRGFGGAVAVAADQVLIGEPDNISRPGTVYIYTRSGGGWSRSGSFTAPGGQVGDGFGASLSLDGSTLLVGADGIVHAYEDSGSGWDHAGTLFPSTASVSGSPELTITREDTSDEFGAAVALSGSFALIGAPGYGDQEEGAAYLFERTTAGWLERDMFQLEDVGEEAAFGSSIAVDGSTAIVGAPGGNAIATYSLSSMGAELIGTLAPDFGGGRGRGGRGGPQPDIGFGAGVAVDGGRAVVAAPAAGAYLTFDWVEGEWTPSDQLRAFSGGGGFGGRGTVSLAFDGRDLWVANPGDGAAIVFSQDESGEWTSARRVNLEIGAPSRLAVGGDFVVLGVPGADGGMGQVAFVSDEDGDLTVGATIMTEIDEFDAVRGGQIDCEDGEAVHWDCSNVDLVGFIPNHEMGADRGIGTNDVWGWTDPETGKEWALVGMRNQTAFVDVSDPSNPVFVGRLPLTEGARPASWRDIKTYADHAFIVSDGSGQHGMQVFDLTRLRDFDGTPETFEPDALYTNVASVHNIVINEDAAMAFAVGSGRGGETCGGGLHMIDISEPLNPTFAGCFADPQTGRASTGYSHDAQCVTYHGPDEAYQGHDICLGSNETALSIADVTDKENPVALSRASYPNFGYSHQGWLDAEHRYFYMNDELDELQGLVDRTRTLVWDVSDLDDPQLILEHLGTQESSDHNLYVVGDIMYQSNYQSGLRVLDISDRENPVEIGYFDTVPYGENTPGFGGSWSNYPFFESGNVIVTSGSEGLFILKPRNERVIS